MNLWIVFPYILKQYCVNGRTLCPHPTIVCIVFLQYKLFCYMLNSCQCIIEQFFYCFLVKILFLIVTFNEWLYGNSLLNALSLNNFSLLIHGFDSRLWLNNIRLLMHRSHPVVYRCLCLFRDGNGFMHA